jgi:outer membrane receptor protein involved in Fe transport
VQANPSGRVEAQPVPSTNAQGAPVKTGQDIIVTGTRIPQVNLTSPAPVTVVTSQDVKLSGTTRVEDLLNQLPSVGASQASGVSNGATGTAEVDLRYLGSKRTLALVNSRRMTPGDPNGTSQAADLNLIPSALIKRVEVLTGGASSTYGADAVAGVVNFIMDTNFTGVRFDGQASVYQHDNRNPSVSHGLTIASPQPGIRLAAAFGRRQFDGTVTIGTAFDDGRGHAVAYFGYRRSTRSFRAGGTIARASFKIRVAGFPVAAVPRQRTRNIFLFTPARPRPQPRPWGRELSPWAMVRTSTISGR